MSLEGRKTGAFERHAQTLLSSLILLLIVWVGATMNRLLESNTLLTVKMGHLEAAVSSVQAAQAGFVQRFEYERENAVNEKRYDKLDGRLTKIEENKR